MLSPSDKIFIIREEKKQNQSESLKRNMMYNIIEEEAPRTLEVSLNYILKNPSILDSQV